MNNPTQAHQPPWLVWAYPVNITTTFNMAPRLEVTKEMRNLGWKVDLIASGPDGTHTVEGVDVLCFSSLDIYFIRHFLFHMRVIQYILRNWKRIDVVLFVQISLPWLLPLRLLGLFSKRRPLFVMDTRTVPMETAGKMTIKDKLRGWFYYLMNSLANTLADGQTAITQRMADVLNIPSNQLWGTWPSGVDLEKFSTSLQNRCWPEMGGPIQIIYIGTLNYERNIMALCQAVLEANRRGMNFSLRLVGDGSEKQDLQAFASQTQGAIKVFEPVPHDQIPAILAEAHIGVLPFPDEEKYRVSSPIKLFEYMGSGLPILATKITCHTDVIGDGEFIFWAETSDQDGLLKALENAWHARSELPRMGLKAQVAAQNWTYAASAGLLNTALRHGLSQKYLKTYLARAA
ncbi:MAG: glycosyltransferase [Anaerolineales bacterium]|nr:glycosyltransferase [Anaerolineales bacterium]